MRKATTFSEMRAARATTPSQRPKKPRVIGTWCQIGRTKILTRIVAMTTRSPANFVRSLSWKFLFTGTAFRDQEMAV
jgi:hypothetical protein